MQAQQGRRPGFAADGNPGYAHAAKDADGVPELPAGEQPGARHDRHAEPDQDVFEAAGRPPMGPIPVWEVPRGHDLSGRGQRYG